MASQLRVDKILPVDGAPTDGGGGIIQVVQATKNDQFSTASTSLTDVTGMSCTITPKFSTSKILFNFSFNLAAERTYPQVGASFAIIRTVSGGSATSLTAGSSGDDDNLIYESNASNVENLRHVINYQGLDSPTTTSATTYKLQVSQFINSGSAGVVKVCHGGYFTSRILLMEVSA